MEIENAHINEVNVARAFTGQSAIFDELYAGNPIIQYKRERVRDHVLSLLNPSSSILELNAGTGDDAIFFAKLGHKIHATDISTGMQEQLKEKVSRSGLGALISAELCSFTELDKLQQQGPYDMIFSNFAGLNCTSELETVLDSFDKLLKPGGIATLVILPKFCIWETLLLFKGKFATATRRLFSRNGRNAKIEGVNFKCWYYSPGFVSNRLRDNFAVEGIEGLCTIVPPSYLENFPGKYPKLFSFLCRKENKLKKKWPWKYTGDYFIISLRKH